jgi:hypothetical protein
MGTLRSQRVHRAIIALCLPLLCGCTNIELEAWDNSGSPSQGTCPDSDYDNGGNVKPKPGLCKLGTGALVSINRRF